ncbi:MAG: hypothetical protein QOH26_1509, partial [Actinomycetota bacterium]|nr:hypothetical protein [Actinomycetota bacterium]
MCFKESPLNPAQTGTQRESLPALPPAVQELF